MKVTFFLKAFSGDLHGRPSQPELSRWAAATQKAPPTWFRFRPQRATLKKLREWFTY